MANVTENLQRWIKLKSKNIFPLSKMFNKKTQKFNSHIFCVQRSRENILYLQINLKE